MAEKIAIVGAGAAGMAAAYLLQRKFSVTLFDSESRLGGHACPVRFPDSSGQEHEIDVAFLVFNDRTYGQFGRWLELLGVAGHAVEAEMSSCFSDPGHNLHYTLGCGLGPMLRQKRNIVSPRFWRMFADLSAFRKRAYRDITTGADLSRITVGEYLAPYGRELRENFVLPLTSAIWSLGSKSMMDFPAASILNYFYNHQLLHGKSEKRWRTFKGSSGAYLRAFARDFHGELALGEAVTRVSRGPAAVRVHTVKSEREFDHVVMATHADLSLRLLADPSADEKALLGAWRYQDNPVTLHRDPSAMHPDAGFWGSWNMRREENGEYLITYWLNRVQGVPTKEAFFLTLGNPSVKESLVLARYSFRHPVFTHESVRTQPALPGLNVGRTSFCGSYFGHGFHEDAVASGAAVAKRFGLGWPNV